MYIYIHHPHNNPQDFPNHTSHPSTRTSTSPPKTYSQTPSSPVSDSPHYAPHTSTSRNPASHPTAADSDPTAQPSTPGNPPRTPNTGTGARRARGSCASRLVARCWLSLGRRLLGSGGGSRLSGLGRRRLGGSLLGWGMGRRMLMLRR